MTLLMTVGRRLVLDAFEASPGSGVPEAAIGGEEILGEFWLLPLNLSECEDFLYSMRLALHLHLLRHGV